MLTRDMMVRMWPRGDARIPGLRQAIVDSAPAVFATYGLTDPMVVAHAMAQFSEECGAGNEVVENLSYTSASRIAAVWPSRFTEVTALPYVRNPKALADKVYNGRMGNREGSDDGFNYRGRGASQVTGREGYDKLGRKVGRDLLGNPDDVNDPQHFLDNAVADFILCGCLPFAQRDDVRGVTHHLNGGYIGLADREQWLKRWKAVLSAVRPDAPMELPKPTDGSLRYGDKGSEVAALQAALSELGYAVGEEDGDFGSATRAALLAYQADSGVPTTGILDAATRAAFANPKPKPVSEARANADAGDLKAAGSETVANADTIKTVGKVVVGAAGAGGVADQTGALDKVKDAADQVSVWRSTIESVQDIGQWALQHWWIIAIVGGAVIWYFAHNIIEKRLADHRSGANMAR